MSDVFVSYSRKDSDWVRELVPPLEAAGFSVRWDHTIPPGKNWDEVIARGIRDAKACIVVWTPDSVVSDWVKEEATIAKEAGKLLPIQVGIDEPPMGFRRIQAADLSRWDGDPQDPQWRLLVTEIGRLVRGASEAPPLLTQPLLERAWRWLRRHRQSGAMIVLGGLALTAMITSVWWYARATAPAQPVEARIPKFAPVPALPAPGVVDPAAVGVFILDTVLMDFDTHFVDTINADGSYTLTGVQEEDGHAQGDANGNYRNVGVNTGRVHTGSVRIIDSTHFQAGTTVYQLEEPLLPRGEPNPSLLGTWTANGLVAGQSWHWTWTSKTPGNYHFEGHMSDHGHTSFVNGLWTATSAVTGQAGGGTYAIVDTGMAINGVVWARR